MGYKDVAKQLKQEIKRAYPRCKVSITVKHVDSIYIKLLEGDFPCYADNFNGDKDGYIQLNHYHIKDDKVISPQMKKFWNKIDNIRQKLFGNITNDDHDPMTDYFSYNYYIHYQIGDWGKPYINTKEKTASKIANMLRITKKLVAYKTSKNLPDKYAKQFISLFYDMSPERIARDGEASYAEQKATMRRLEQDWKKLERLVGRKVTYDEIAKLC